MTSSNQLSSRHLRIVESSAAIQADPPKPSDHSFIASPLVQCTLPHRSPGHVPSWQRRNGNFTLTIAPGINYQTGQPLGLPFGVIPRLLLFWLTTEALRTGSRRLELGDTLAGFMRDIGLDPSRGGVRSDARRLRDQMNRLFHARITFHRSDDPQSHARWSNMDIAPEGELWWEPSSADQVAMFGSWIELGEKFFEAITRSPVPVDLRAVRAIKHSSLYLDLYAFATYRTFRAATKGEPAFVPWRGLNQQLGAAYANPKDFKRKAKRGIEVIQLVYPQLKVAFEPGGVVFYPSSTAILPAVR